MKRPITVCTILSVLALLTAAPPGGAEPPLDTGDSRAARPRLAEQARRYVGAPYLTGGETAAGFDCSGLIYRVYLDVLRRGIPRTVRDLYRYSERVPLSDLEEGDLVFFNTTGPLSHVGLYVGDSRVVHAASEGRRTGVIVSSLEEPYYRNRFAGGGRVIPTAGWIGFRVRLGAAPLLGTEGGLLRGVGLTGQAWYSLFGHNIGLETHLEYDATLHVASLPVLLNVAVGRRAWLMAGRTFSVGSGEYTADGAAREYRPDDGLPLNTLGLGFELASFRIAGAETGLFAEATYTHLEPSGTTVPEAATDMGLGFKAYIGACLKLRY